MKSYDNVEKLLKGNLKRKVKLTLATVVAFLITGSLGFGIELGEEYNGKGYEFTGEIEEDLAVKENSEIKEIKINGLLKGYIINNGKIEKLINNNNLSDNKNNAAIENYGEIGEIINNGIINRKFAGIYSEGRIGKIINKGTIYGEACGIYSGGNIDVIENNGVIKSDYQDALNLVGQRVNVNVEQIINNGLIDGNGGIEGDILKNIINNGIIKGRGGSLSIGVYYGVSGKIENNGYIYGEGYSIHKKGTEEFEFLNKGTLIGTVQAVTKNDEKGINIGTIKGKLNPIVNVDTPSYGLAIGNSPVDKNEELTDNFIGFGGINNGMLYDISKGSLYVKDENEFSLNGITYTVKNATVSMETAIKQGQEIEKIGYEYTEKDSNKEIETLSIKLSGEKNNIIYNGLNNTVEIEDDTKINNSIINAYENAISFGNSDKKELTLNNVIVNGGLKDIDSDKNLGMTISGNENNNILNILGNSVINGNIDLGEGNDKVVIEDSAIVNGNLNGNAGDDDILLLGKERVASRFRSFSSAPKSSINILSKIEGFEIGEINADTTLFETAEIKGMEKLVINEEGKLNLRLDTTDKVGGDGEDKNNIKAGALHDTGVAISGTGTLNIVSAGLTEDDKITFGKDTTIEGDTKVEMDSAILDGDINDNIVIVVKNNNVKLSNNVARHGKLKEIYTQIVKDNLKKINEIITTAEKDKVKQVEMLSSYLNGVYAENPYSLSSEFSRKSAELMRNSILGNREKAIKNEQITYGGLTHQDGSLDGSYYGMDANKENRYSGDIELESNLFGAYGAIEYGYFDKTSLGFVVGGSRGDSKVGSSKVDGSTIYTGLYSKTDLPYNLRLTVGTGLQHGSYDAERNYLSDNHKGNYSDTAFDIYANIKYTQMLQENLFLDYGFGMSYTYVDQDSISEENKNLAIDVDSKTFDYTDAKLDLGLRKVIGNNFGKHNLKLGASYSYMLDGADEENLRGNFKGTNSFDILVAEKEKDTFGVNLGYELERENGFMLNVNAGYNFSNSDNDEVVVGVQIGKKL